jgi:hypothetical protein
VSSAEGFLSLKSLSSSPLPLSSLLLLPLREVWVDDGVAAEADWE